MSVPSPDAKRRTPGPPMECNQLEAILSIKIAYKNNVAITNTLKKKINECNRIKEKKTQKNIHYIYKQESLGHNRPK